MLQSGNHYMGEKEGKIKRGGGRVFQNDVAKCTCCENVVCIYLGYCMRKLCLLVMYNSCL